VLEAIKDKNDLMTKLNHYLGPVIKHAYPAGHSPTQMLGKFLVDLALGDGAPIAGMTCQVKGGLFRIGL